MNDFELLREYAEHRSEPAFAQLVGRHLDLVLATAARVVGEAHLAEDVAQRVFMDLARKAGSLPGETVLAAWLYRSAWLCAAGVVRAARRRQARERKAMDMTDLDASGRPVWEALAPCLDEAMSQLEAEDQEALVLRFFQQQNLREVGRTLGLGEDAAQKRVSRALEKLRGILAHRGVGVSAAVLATAIADNALQAAPAGLASLIAKAALAKAAAPAGLGLLLHKAGLLTTAQTAALTALVGTLVVVLEGHRLGALRAEQARSTDLLAQARQTLATLQDQDAALRGRLSQSAEALRRLDQRSPAPSGPAPGQLPDYVRVPKDLLAQSKLGWLTRTWQLTPLQVEVLGMRPDEAAAANQWLARFVTEVQTLQAARATPSRERTLGADWWRKELESREFKSFELTACTNELESLRSNLVEHLEGALGTQRTQLLTNSVDYSIRDRCVLLGGQAGLLTLVRPAKPSDPIVAYSRSWSMLLEARALATLPPSLHQVVEQWWDLSDLDHR